MKKGFCMALTGGIACGKSVVADLFRRWGAEVADADEAAHALLAPGGECVAAVVAAFGPQVRAAAIRSFSRVHGRIRLSRPFSDMRPAAADKSSTRVRLPAWRATARRSSGEAIPPS